MSFTAEQQTGKYKTSHYHYQTVSYDSTSLYATVSGQTSSSRTKTANRIVLNGTHGSGTTREDATYSTEVSSLQPSITVFFWRRTA